MTDNPYATYLDWKSWETTEFARLTPDLRLTFAKTLAPLQLPATARVLELGFGNGQFLAFAREQNLQITALEIEPALLDRAKSAGFDVHHSQQYLTTAPSDHFDAIISFDVLEHLTTEELIQLFQTAARILKPGGHMLARIPNGDSPFGRPHQHGDLTHHSTIGTTKLEQLATLSGLTLLSTQNPALPLPWNRPHTMALRLARKLGRTGVEYLLGFLYYGKRLPLDPNLVAIFCKPA